MPLRRCRNDHLWSDWLYRWTYSLRVLRVFLSLPGGLRQRAPQQLELQTTHDCLPRGETGADERNLAVFYRVGYANGPNPRLSLIHLGRLPATLLHSRSVLNIARTGQLKYHSKRPTARTKKINFSELRKGGTERCFGKHSVERNGSEERRRPRTGGNAKIRPAHRDYSVRWREELSVALLLAIKSEN